jgi:hypothetical protein
VKKITHYGSLTPFCQIYCITFAAERSSNFWATFEIFKNVPTKTIIQTVENSLNLVTLQHTLMV